jgi:hypothetical protein
VKHFGFHFNYTDGHYDGQLEVVGHTTGLVTIKDSDLVGVIPEGTESVTLDWDQVEALHQILGQLIEAQSHIRKEQR